MIMKESSSYQRIAYDRVTSDPHDPMHVVLMIAGKESTCGLTVSTFAYGQAVFGPFGLAIGSGVVTRFVSGFFRPVG